MTVDREELRRAGWLLTADELDDKDRCIADLQHEAGLLKLAVENRDADVRELESRLATAHDMIRHLEQECDAWPAAYRQRAAVTDARIKELELQVERFVAILSVRDEHGEVGRTVDALVAARARIGELETEVMRLRCLLPSEET